MYKLERLTVQGLIPETPPAFIEGKNRDSYQASVSLAVLGDENRALRLKDTLKFDSSGQVMEYPPRPAGQIVDPIIQLENQPVLTGFSLERRYDRWSWHGILQVAPLDMELVNAGAGFGYSRNISRLVLAASADWIRNRIRESGVYHEHTPSHTDLEEVYIQHALQAMACGSTRGLSFGGLYETGSCVNPYFRAARLAYDVFSADNPNGPAFVYQHSHYQAGLVWEPVANMPLQFALGLSVPDSRTNDHPAFSAGVSMAKRWAVSEKP